MKEYRRDVGRYIHGETSIYPLLPRGYFDGLAEEALTALHEKVICVPELGIIGSCGCGDGR